MCSTPPIMYISPRPLIIPLVASCNACIEEPHKRLTVTAPVVRGIWVSNWALRAMLKPCSLVCCTQPQIMSSISAGSTPGLRSSNAVISAADIVSARTFLNTPAFERPIGVRTQSITTTSFIISLLGN